MYRLPLALFLAGSLAGTAPAAPDPAAEARSYRQLADLYRARGDLDGAAVAARAAVAAGVRDLGEGDPRTAEALVSLAEVQEAAGDDAGAAASYRRAVDARRGHFLEKGWTPGARARQAAVLRSYVEVLRRLGDTTEVEELLSRAVTHERAADEDFRAGLRKELATRQGPTGPTSPRRRYKISVFLNGQEIRELEEDRDLRFSR